MPIKIPTTQAEHNFLCYGLIYGGVCWCMSSSPSVQTKNDRKDIFYLICLFKSL